MKKDLYLHVRMDEETMQILKCAATQTTNGNVSDYIRNLIRKDNRQMTDDLAAGIHGLEHQMIRIGNNINQIARSANAGLMSSAQRDRLMDEMNEVRLRVEQLATEVLLMRGGS